ncbi:MAG TPA: FAD-dependent oxidoreductase, partial [Candidatus Omnitrophota bacterium]|nr:FAD-dependent oxidoreductase [Candidatus Omnitrophota bacterium]
MGPRVIIVGGGISGLATSFYLRTHFSGISVTLLEASDRPGEVAGPVAGAALVEGRDPPLEGVGPLVLPEAVGR